MKRIVFWMTLGLALGAFAFGALFGFGWTSNRGALGKLEVFEREGIARLSYGDFGGRTIDDVDDLFSLLDEAFKNYGIRDARSEFRYQKSIDAPFGKVFKLTQVYDGFNVFGRSVTVATDRSGVVTSISGNYLSSVAPTNTVVLTALEAIAIVKDQAGLARSQATVLDTESDCDLSATLEIYSLDSAPIFAFDVLEATGKRFFVDAQTGAIVGEIATTNTAENIKTVQHPTTQTNHKGESVEVVLERTQEAGETGHRYFLADALRNIYIMDAAGASDLSGQLYQNQTGVFEDTVAISAFENFVATFDFYTNPQNIGVSLWGADGSVNQIHDDADEADEMIVYAYLHFGIDYQNAAYISGLREENPKNAVFIFGDGVSGELFDFAASRDVVGHEYQHAVTAYSADLIYLNGSGAINEAISDIFGALIEGFELDDDRFWLIGEDVVDSSVQKALRDMKDPISLGYPAKNNGAGFFPFCYQNHDHGSCDNGGVHYNSSIIGHAAYQMYNLEPTLFTKPLMGELWYSTLLLLQQDSGFEDLRVVMTRAAKLLGYSDTIIDTIGLAFDEVNIFGGEGPHSITFERGNMTGEPPASMVLDYGESFVVPQSNLTMNDYELIGWSQSGSSNDLIYYTGQSYKMPAYDLVLFPVVALSMWNGLQPTTWEGDGLFDSPYLIQSEADLATLAYYINNPIIEPNQVIEWKHFRLTRDLDLQNIPWIPIGMNWITHYINFGDIWFDGGGHKIFNLNIDGSALPATFISQGLFGRINCSVSNLGIESGSVNTSAKEVGALAGILLGDIVNCYNKIAVTNTSPDSNSYTGGLVGANYWMDCVSSYNEGDVSGNGYVGGIAARVERRVISCYNTGNIEGGTAAGGIAGVKGYDLWVEASPFANCYNTGTIRANSAGGILGGGTDVYFGNCINTGAIFGTSVGARIGGIAGYLGFEPSYTYTIQLGGSANGVIIAGSKSTGKIHSDTALYSGGIVGKLFDEKVSRFVTLDNNLFKSDEGLTAIGNILDFDQRMHQKLLGKQPLASDDEVFTGDFDFDNVDYYKDEQRWSALSFSLPFAMGYEWQILGENQMPTLATCELWMDFAADSFSGGDGSEQSPYLIGSASELALLAHCLNRASSEYNGELILYCYFALSADIDLAGKLWVGIDAGHINLDGRGYTIKNMFARDYAYRIESVSYGGFYTDYYWAGLFSECRAGTIKNIVIENCNLLSSAIAGGIAARARWNNSFFNCEVRSGYISSYEAAGGIVGVWGYGVASVEFCLNKAKVNGAIIAGGIVGALGVGYEVGVSGKIESSVNMGEVMVSSRNGSYILNTYAGGIVGLNETQRTQITNCINAGDITNLDFLGSSGGLVGGFGEVGSISKEGELSLNIEYCLQLGSVFQLPSVHSAVGAIAALESNGFERLGYLETNSFVVNLKNIGVLRSVPVAFGISKDTDKISLTEDNIVFWDDATDIDIHSLEYLLSCPFLSLDREAREHLFRLVSGEYNLVTFFVLGELYSAELVHILDPVQPPAPPSLEGFSFLGWVQMIDGQLVSVEFPLLVRRSLQFFAVFEDYVDVYTEGLEFKLVDDHYVVSGYSGTDQNIIIPSVYNYLLVTEIVEDVFRYRHDIVSVFIPYSIEKIGMNAFGDCFALNSVQLGEGSRLTFIGYGAFMSCQSLTQFEMVETIETIEAMAFYDCGLVSVVLPASLQTLGEGAFSGSYGSIFSSICSFEVDGKNTNFVAVDGVLYSADLTILVAYPCNKEESHVVIDSNVVEIMGYAFSGNKHVQSVLVRGDLAVGRDAFSNCMSLIEVRFLGNVWSLGMTAFYYSIALERVDFGQNSTFDSMFLSFMYCESLVYVNIPTSVTTISDYVFYGCKSLESIIIPSSVTMLQAAFVECNKLTIFVEQRLSKPATWSENWNEDGCPVVWGALVYRLNFLDTQGQLIFSQRITSGITIVAPIVQPLAGQLFVGWDFDGDGKAEQFPEVITSNLTASPVFRIIEQYTYTFFDDDGTVLKTMTVDENTIIIAPPETPSKLATEQFSFAFQKWQIATVESGMPKPSNQGDFTQEMTITANIAFIAKYTATTNQYTYTFYDDDGTVLSTTKVDYGTTITPPETPSKEGYVFQGWYMDTDHKTKFEPAPTTQDMQIHASYSKLKKSGCATQSAPQSPIPPALLLILALALLAATQIKSKRPHSTPS